jgi:hypothetical protein
MSFLSQSIQRLREGFDRHTFAFYCKAFIALWWEVFWGPTLIGIPFGLYTLYYAPARKWFAAYIVFVAFLTGYYLWRDYHVRLQPAFAIAKILPQTWTHPGTGEHAMLYYFEVINMSETTSIHDVEVQLTEIVPEVENLEWLPV